ncbi:uncharacterized protein LOC143197696 [Rhynchophorus ferrugineus]|uniref:uncharacterized protein LOC143197696 n=1 Tax=Rhynchophorus ferrugineus TaxID=354439 RepID=UPI003FCEDE6A
MVGCRCSYKNCTNTTKTTENLHFFHYPVKYRERCIQWIENACKPSFYELEEDQLRNKIVCELHFETKWFLNSQRKRLLPGAVPTIDVEDKDSGVSISSMETEAPIYLPSNQYNDVKVVPANDDGTVFILDTDNMFTVSPKIESYIIKNGVLVPTNIQNSPTKLPKTFSNRSKPMGNYSISSETDLGNVNTPSGLPGTSKQVDKQKNEVKEDVIESNDASQQTENPCNVDLLFYDSNDSHRFEIASDNEEKKPNTATVKQTQVPQKTLVTKSYLKKIKQHSREIASIKRMLMKQRIYDTKPNMKTILNILEEQVPPTLLTVVSLLLGEKNELSDDDVEFFTTIHRSSPEVYQLLSEKYKWNLPSVDIVEPLE